MKNKLIEILLGYYRDNQAEFPEARKEEMEARDAYSELSDVINRYVPDGKEQAMNALCDLFACTQRAGFYAGFQSAQTLLSDGSIKKEGL